VSTTSNTITVYVPRDSAALSMGADDVAAAIAQHAAQQKQTVRIVRNGSRGMLWLEPLVEVQTAQGRIAYGPVATADVASLFAAGFLQGGAHALRHGLGHRLAGHEVEGIVGQQRDLVFAGSDRKQLVAQGDPRRQLGTQLGRSLRDTRTAPGEMKALDQFAIKTVLVDLSRIKERAQER